MRKFYIFIFLLILNGALYGASYHGELSEFEQPDGTVVSLKLFGDHAYIRAETPEGYTVIRDEESGWICYAKLNEDKSKLISTGVKYLPDTEGEQGPKGQSIEKHLEISQAEITRIRRAFEGQDKHASRSMASSQVAEDVVGDFKGLCILVDFSDYPSSGGVPKNIVEDFCNGDNFNTYGINGSLKEYYNDVSFGKLNYENYVFGYFRAPKTFAEYNAMPYTQGAQEILTYVLGEIDRQGFDFSQLTTDDNGFIKAINLMYTGYPPTWAQGMWYHKTNWYGFQADGVTVSTYNTSPLNIPRGSRNGDFGLSTVAHENGHMIGNWPDTYKYGDTGPDGLGTFDIMCSYGSSTNPVIPNPYFKMLAGWMNVVDITNFTGIKTDLSNSNTVFKYVNKNNPTEFFLIEARRREGRSYLIPDEGLTIWHIYEQGNNQNYHSNQTPHQVYLEHANNNVYDHSYACYDQGYRDEFDNFTAPSSKWYDGSESGLMISKVSYPGASMTFQIGDVTLPPTADFSANSSFICPGQSVEFTDLSISGPESWSWEFEGGSPSVSSDQNPTITYYNEGTYKVKLTASNANGSDVVEKVEYITVNSSGLALPMEESFEGSDFPREFWTIDNPDNNLTWEKSTRSGFQSSSCVIVNNADYDNVGATDDLNIGTYDMSTNSKKELSFYVAYTKFDNNSPDQLSVLVSTDCGASWQEVFNKTHSELETVPVDGGDESNRWVPTTDSDWRKEVVDLTQFAGNNSVRIKFRNTNGYGTRIWLDNISITSEKVSDIVLSSEVLETGVSVYPNPVKDVLMVKSNQVDDALEVNMYSIDGKLVRSVHANNGLAFIQVGDLLPGIYILDSNVNGQNYREKVVVE
ncbi:M6 family metalloprotease domain-containing protein [Aureibacter tunicatorum]|uniref:M6 family metalloprotease-like protein n=1 Tax=Aureibacter tunicatorum TaxID=866807 RepID=A0AAE4BRZ9_9BACT|nr:M6 family metalloprotease domain-containing protein [Aureibacter tunicatorum]MDR6239231.1 M6 family metalloprotease-like protein [Aureibacter tunicatorum]BDD04844.1 hypothetical protein AUTU_23270 [Aureibacter tunicatorum]